LFTFKFEEELKNVQIEELKNFSNFRNLSKVEGPFLIKLGSFKAGRFSFGFENVHGKNLNNFLTNC
jgi:hypothetical protein